MQPDSFVSFNAGDVVKHRTGYYAYVPKPPPSTIDYNLVATELSRADAVLSELSGLGRFIPNADLLIRPYIQREAVASSRMEGTQADLDDLLREDLQGKPQLRSDAFEIRNYISALNRGIALLADLPIASRLIRTIHADLLDSSRGKERLPGEFRRSQNWIAGSGPADALYVPPPPEQLLDLIAIWERFINAQDPMPDLIRCAIAHEYFETIHPFLDGNGRIGRLLITLMLMQRGRITKPLLYVSSYIEQTKNVYYERLQAVRTHGQRIEWIKYFLKAVELSSKDALKRADSLLNVRNSLLDRPALKSQHKARTLLDELFINPYVTVARTAEVLHVSETTADKTVKLLESQQILREITGKNWGRMWVADPVLRAIRQPMSL